MAQTCYRHPQRETGVSCSNCGRPICPECMTSTSVGMRCPECASERTQVRVGAGALGPLSSQTPATYALIAINAIVFIAAIAAGSSIGNGSGGSFLGDWGLFGPAVNDGEYYRLITGGFLHAGIIHIGFNMYVLYIAGRLLEPAIGTPRFLGLYFVSLLAGSAGALLLDPNTLTVGASGAIFGLMAAALLIARQRGRDDIVQQFGFFIVINLVLTFSISGISIGGHLGGLIGGFLVGALVAYGERRKDAGGVALEVFGMAAIAIAAVGVALVAAGQSGSGVI